jgi:hypothetical protein
MRLRGSAAGERCFVIGNGPSLTTSDLDLLRGELAIASNGIFLAYSQTEFRPTYYLVEDTLVAEDRAGEIAEIRGSTQVLPLTSWPRWGPETNVSTFRFGASIGLSRGSRPT